MADLASYSLDDFLLFSPEVYFRLFELHNRALWPAPALTFGVALAILALLARATPLRLRASLAVFGLFWLWIAGSFFWQRYQSINWVAAWVAPVAALQGLVLIAGALAWRNPLNTRMAPAGRQLLLVLYSLALFGYPLLGVFSARPWQGAELIGIAPDPTAVATVAIVAMTRGWWKWLLWPLPLCWCVVTGLTLYALDADRFVAAPLAAAFAVIVASAAVRRS